MQHTLPSLLYAYDALEPHVDARTMEIHHTKHHQAYIDKLNGVLEKYPELQEKELSELLSGLDSLSIDEVDKIALRNHGGGHSNHALFWQIMGPEKAVDEQLVKDIEKSFGSVDDFKESFSQAAATQFGSGWAWLVRDSVSDHLKVYSTPNQDSPYLQGDTPVLGLDVWEHAYYLKYQNKRADYIEAWWNVLTLI